MTVLRESDRPWPRPARPWALAMRWHDLLFAHWPIDAATLAPLLPLVPLGSSGLELDSFEGTAWIGVVPFRMSNVRPRGVPGIPRLSAFPELNVRTYVTRDGKPGVWFLSLDAAQRLAVLGARALFHLPYFHARMRCRERDGWIEYASERIERDAPPASFAARYRPLGPPFHARAGSLDHFLTARYCLYARTPDGRVLRGDVDHAPWPLQRAEATIERDTMLRGVVGPDGVAAAAAPSGLGLAARTEPPLVRFARRLDVVAWSLAP